LACLAQRVFAGRFQSWSATSAGSPAPGWNPQPLSFTFPSIESSLRFPQEPCLRPVGGAALTSSRNRRAERRQRVASNLRVHTGADCRPRAVRSMSRGRLPHPEAHCPRAWTAVNTARPPQAHSRCRRVEPKPGRQTGTPLAPSPIRH
jgi:hypothetical protein